MSGTGVPLEQAPFLELTEEHLRAIAERHGFAVGSEKVERLASMGIVHSIYALGDDYVLRVPKLHPGAVAATRRTRRVRGRSATCLRSDRLPAGVGP